MNEQHKNLTKKPSKFGSETNNKDSSTAKKSKFFFRLEFRCNNSTFSANAAENIKIMSTSKTSPTKLATNQEISRDLWVPDSEAKACFYCNSIFSTFRRKHHCRICGSVFCSKCCTKQQIEPALLSRVCIPCSKLSLNTCKTALRMNRQNESLKNQIQGGFAKVSRNGPEMT